jgi:hypothetical protein
MVAREGVESTKLHPATAQLLRGRAQEAANVSTGLHKNTTQILIINQDERSKANPNMLR